MPSDDKLERIIATRLALKKRFEAKMAASPSVADDRPEGEGAPNRHGMPKLPVGQTETKKWPVLDLGVTPNVSTEKWTLTVDGACEHPIVLGFDDFLGLPQIEDQSDFHCVTTWSRMDMHWIGVRLADVLALSTPHADAGFLMCHGYDGYQTNLSLEEALKPDVLLVHRANGAPLPTEHGGPVRVITPQLYAWKGAKWVSRLELMKENRPGFWEVRGYSNTAYPWRNDRYG
ncbi:MAG TPA: sulfite oxidase-like oxidoreductase [Polyangiaceae bacterium]